MNEFESKIYQIITDRNGIKGAEIAALLEVDKRVVNSTLEHSESLRKLVKQESDYKWYSINQHYHNDNSDIETPEPDEQLRNLCNYYLHCISAESNNSVSAYLTSRYELPYVVLGGISHDYLDSASVVNFLNRTSRNNTKTAYFGYPNRIYTCYGRGGQPYKKIAPVFLFPIDFNAGRINISNVPNINVEIIKAFCDNSNENICRELVLLEQELGLIDAENNVEIDELVLRLRKIRDWDWKEKIDPYTIPEPNDICEFEDGIYNRPIIISADKELYTQGLVSELTSLSKIASNEYKGTALYSWIKGEYDSVNIENFKPLLEVLPLNSEQYQAVETALKSNLTIVTGPPGTGKSQVVTDLLINIAWNGKSVLFSSKNNKAVDVVDARVNGLSRRPVLLRIGSTQYASRLAEIIEGLLNGNSNLTDRSEMELLLNEYDLKSTEKEELKREKNKTILLRNRLDNLEQAYCLVRDEVEEFFEELDTNQIGVAEQFASSLKKAYFNADKQKQRFLNKLIWPIISGTRREQLKNTLSVYNNWAEKYGLDFLEESSGEEYVEKTLKDAISFDDALVTANAYKSVLLEFETTEALESIDRKLVENKECLARISTKLWDKWLLSQNLTFSNREREEMSNFIAAVNLTGRTGGEGNEQLSRQYATFAHKMTKYLHCWAVTSLSAKSRVPFTPGMFDYVIIDEASQCDIASIIPLLYRAKHAVIIGDPKQLSHISQLSKEQDVSLLNSYNVPPAWSYSSNSLYALAVGKVKLEDIVQLRDHFRSCADIIEFSNNQFYEGRLRTATRYNSLRTPAGEKPGIRWLDTKGNTIRPGTGSAYNLEEVRAVIKELKRLVESGYLGTIGVTTPFREQADKIRSALEKSEPQLYTELFTKHEFLVDTVHKFQGDERDLMIFTSVVSNGTLPSALGFLNSTGNLFNVAITRARAVLVVVGDASYCSTCGVEYLNRFVKYYYELNTEKNRDEQDQTLSNADRNYPKVDNEESVSDWEKLFYAKLYDAGIITIPQYRTEKYRLDLAIILPNGNKLDIEVDGAMYHRDWNGELCYRDQLRNQRLFELGWDVKRFWVYEIRDRMNQCINEVRQWIQINSTDK